MSQSGKRSRQREQLILAMLQQPTREKAAASIGMSTTTAWRIWKTPEFQAEFRTARRDTYSHGIARLQQATSVAASTVIKVLIDLQAKDADRLRAAKIVFDESSKGLLIEDLAARLTDFEKNAA